LSFDEVVTQEAQTGIPFGFKDYLTLVDWAGRAILDDKRGHIPNQLPTILEHFSIDSDIYLQNSTQGATTNSDAG
jgi:hypothetical protein